MISKQFLLFFWIIVGVLGLDGVTEAKETRDIAKQSSFYRDACHGRQKWSTVIIR